jgi:hypothetical protein
LFNETARSRIDDASSPARDVLLAVAREPVAQAGYGLVSWLDVEGEECPNLSAISAAAIPQGKASRAN